MAFEPTFQPLKLRTPPVNRVVPGELHGRIVPNCTTTDHECHIPLWSVVRMPLHEHTAEARCPSREAIIPTITLVFSPPPFI